MWFMGSKGLVSTEITLSDFELPLFFPGKQFSRNIFIFHDSWEEKQKDI